MGAAGAAVAQNSNMWLLSAVRMVVFTMEEKWRIYGVVLAWS
jgi:hypothetical protein